MSLGRTLRLSLRQRPRRRLARWWWLAVWLLSFSARASDPGGNLPVFSNNLGLDPARAEALEAACLAAMDELKSPGLALGVVVGDTLAFEGYYGWADLRSRKAFDPDTLLRVASISKTMTTVGLLQLLEQGRFQLDDDINRYLEGPKVRPAGEQPITFRRLLTHTSGGGELVMARFAPAITDGLIPRPLRPKMEYPPIDRLHRTHRMLYRVEPGEKFAYCNYGFVYLGAAIERMSGESFPDYMRKNLFEVLGMSDSSYVHDPARLERLSTGYFPAGQSYLPFSSFTWLNLPAAGVTTTVRDMAKYLAAMLGGGANREGRVLEPETLELAFSFQHSFDRRQEGYGLGFRIYGDNVWGRKLVGHGGNYLTETSQFLLAPADRVGVFVFSNSSASPAEPVAWLALKTILDPVEPSLPEVEADRGLWKELIGYYGPEHRDLNTSMRLYLGGPRRYRVMELEGELKLVETSEGRRRARTLVPAQADDPDFFRLVDDRAGRPLHVSFHREGDGRIFMVPGGLSQYVKLGPLRSLGAKLTEEP